jgi:hypothetical protein
LQEQTIQSLKQQVESKSKDIFECRRSILDLKQNTVLKLQEIQLQKPDRPAAPVRIQDETVKDQQIAELRR